MQPIRIGMTTLAALHLLLAGFGALVGSFADGGGVSGYLIMVALHPVVALALLAAVVWQNPPRFAVVALAALLAVNVAADVAVAASIGSGGMLGDWWLPLVFSVVPVIGLGYVLAGRGRNRPPAAPTPAVAA